jgi:hypothetical protein
MNPKFQIATRNFAAKWVESGRNHTRSVEKVKSERRKPDALPESFTEKQGISFRQTI